LLIKIILLMIVLFLVVLSLSGGSDSITVRWQTELWNLGHIILFSLITFSIYKFWPSLQGMKVLSQVFYLIIITLVLGIIIESIQFFTEKGTADLIDIRRNFIGTFLGFVFAFTISKKNVSILLRGLAISIVIIEAIPTFLTAADEFNAFNSFPILSDFESELELSRWSGEEDFSINDSLKFNGKSSLKMIFGTADFSGVSLEYFPGEWDDYTFLKFNIYLPLNDSLEIICRIHDANHEKTIQAYEDRFDKRFVLIKGWNEIVVSLKEVEASPKNRKMDLQNIKGVAIFTINHFKDTVVYLDFIRLE